MSRGFFNRKKAEAETQARREAEGEKHAAEMASYGAPEDCRLTPFDCVLLSQWIMGADNVPPAWIAAASDAWLDARGLDARALRPFAPGPLESELAEARP